MGKVTKLEITLANDVNVFPLGDTIKGEVVVEVSDEKDRGLNKVKGIWVQFKGEAKNKWKEETEISVGDVDVSYTSKNKAKEEYFDSVKVLFGAGEQDPVIKDLGIPSGTHTYPFEYEIPYASMPAPFEGRYGYVKYTMEATVSLERAIVNTLHTEVKQFSMFGQELDLNVLPGMETPVKKEEQITNCCGCGSTVEMTITVELPKQGYVPGEPIYFNGQIDNLDKDERLGLKAKLVQEVKFRTSSDTKKEDGTVAKTADKIECPKGRVTDYKFGPLLIPAVPPSGLPGCDIIGITYYIQVSNEECNFTMEFPITIGTVPLRRSSPVKSDEVTVTEIPKDNGGVVYDAFVADDETPSMSFKEPNYLKSDDFLPSYRYFNFLVDTLPEPKT
ncbi:arrestin domain-containing protein 3-like [Asterias rubens]|uniref:arrestin domain-containing protein 3-like n=1 Tax=Asterias rubens TaxID=7604 RepID=UPI0014556755|nr:arrestin domain-containing protein 3-like [Asterias rubens]